MRGFGATCIPTVGYASLTYGYSHLATAWLFCCKVKIFHAFALLGIFVKWEKLRLPSLSQPYVAPTHKMPKGHPCGQPFVLLFNTIVLLNQDEFDTTVVTTSIVVSIRDSRNCLTFRRY